LAGIRGYQKGVPLQSYFLGRKIGLAAPKNAGGFADPF
jgi:hypothetical protein